MTLFIIRRLMQGILVVWLMTVVVFLGINVVGDPTQVLISPDCAERCMRLAIRAMGLDLPLHEQYFVFLGNALEGNLGKSFVAGSPALKMVVERIPATLELTFAAMFLAITIGIPLGMWAGARPTTFSARLIMGGSVLGFSLPAFWVAMMLIIVFALEFRWLPTTGRGDSVEVFGIPVSILTTDGLKHLVLPAINLGLFNMMMIIRLTRSGMRETLLMDYVKFARAKGLAATRIMFVHVLKIILIPIVTVLGLELGNTIAFAVVTETIFAWPGMGKLLIDSINTLDRPVVVAFLMIVVVMIVVINLIVDIAYSILDPRVRVGARIE